jgi:hypothetical protein
MTNIFSDELGFTIINLGYLKTTEIKSIHTMRNLRIAACVNHAFLIHKYQTLFPITQAIFEEQKTTTYYEMRVH